MLEPTVGGRTRLSGRSVRGPDTARFVQAAAVYMQRLSMQTTRTRKSTFFSGGLAAESRRFTPVCCFVKVALRRTQWAALLKPPLCTEEKERKKKSAEAFPEQQEGVSLCV